MSGLLLRIGVWGLVGLLLLVAAAIFVASRTVTLQWAAQKAVQFSDGKLRIEGISGSVLKEISADSVQWRDGGIDLTVTAPRLRYEPFTLLDGVVRIERISAASVDLALPAATGLDDGAPQMRLPPAMAAMLPIAIERVDIDRLSVRRAQAELLEARNVEAVFRHDGDRLNASLLNADVAVGKIRIGIRGEAAVLVRAPYAADGRFSVRVPAAALEPTPLRVDVRLNGPLEELALRAGTIVRGAAVEARTVLFPLDPRPLRQVRLDLKDLDLSRHDATLPATRLNVTFDAEVMPAWANERKPVLIGPVTVVNALAGTADRGRVPLSTAKAVVSYVDGRLEVQRLQASGPLGELTGDGWFERDSFRLALASDTLRLQGIDATLAPRTLKARLAVEPIRGTASAEGGPVAANRLKLDLEASDAALAVDMKAELADRRLSIGQAQVRLKTGTQAGAGRASFSGNVGVASPWPVDLSGDFHDFDPAQLLAMPPALLNGKWRMAGRIGGLAAAGGAGADRGLIEADIALEQSRFRGLPLAGGVAATLAFHNSAPQRLSAVKAALKWGTGTVDAAGALGEAADTLRVVFAAPKVGDLVDGVVGTVSGRATLRGNLQAPAVLASVEGKRLVVDRGGMRARVADATLELKSERLQSGVYNLQARLGGIELARTISSAAVERVRFNRLTATVDGSYAEHSADIEAVGKDQFLRLAAKGALGDDGTWRGQVRELAASHPWLKLPAGDSLPMAGAGTGRVDRDIELLQPFALEAGPHRVSARDARFGVQGARLNVRQADWQDSVLDLEADARGIAARWLGRFIDLQALYGPANGSVNGNRPANDGRAPKSTPVAAARQELRLGAAIDFKGSLGDSSVADWTGTLLVSREMGDLWLADGKGDAPASAGLRTLDASATINARVVKVVVNVDGENIGRISGEAQTTLQGHDEPAWAKASLAASPLAGRLELAMNSFRWISPLVGESWRVDGALSAGLDLAGTLTRPRADGVVTGSNLSAHEPALGMRLHDGVLAAEFSGDRVDVKVLRFESGKGSVAISGLLQAPGSGSSQARVVIDRLPISLGDGQRVVLSGSTTATLEDRSLGVSGRLIADEGIIDLKNDHAFPASNDVAIGDGNSPARRAAKAAAGAAGNAVADEPPLRKTGVMAAPVRPQPVGSENFRIMTDIEVDLGRHFRVAGSGLEANLSGAIRLRGNFPEAPRATGTVDLVNGSFRIDGRKLRIARGRVVFDGPLHDPSLDIVAIREHPEVAPGFEISGHASAPQIRLVSESQVTDAEKPGSAQGAVAALGKRLASRLFGTYEQSLRGVWNILKLQYEITDRLSLSVQAGSDSAMDLLWFFPFD